MLGRVAYDPKSVATGSRGVFQAGTTSSSPASLIRVLVGPFRLMTQCRRFAGFALLMGRRLEEVVADVEGSDAS